MKNVLINVLPLLSKHYHYLCNMFFVNHSVENIAFSCLNWLLVCVQTLFCFIIVLFTLGNSMIRLFTFENKRFFIEKGDERVNSQRFQGKLRVFSVFFIVKISWNIRRNIRLLYQILFICSGSTFQSLCCTQ